MRPGLRVLAAALLQILLLSSMCASVYAAPDHAPAESAAPDLASLNKRLQELYTQRAEWLLSEPGSQISPLESAYHTSLATARWALNHEQGKIRYVKQWAANRGVKIVESKPEIRTKYLSGTSERARFYVAESLAVGYAYADQPAVNRFGVGSHHIIELRRVGDRWLIGMEWYTDPLGDASETPDITPALLPGDSPGPPSLPAVALPQVTPVAGRGYDRAGAVRYADTYCGLAWGCGNGRRYNPKYRNYSGIGGDCTNFVSQALRDGGKLRVGNHAQVSSLAATLRRSGRASLVARAPFHVLWKQAKNHANGFRSLLALGDLIAFQEKGKMAHFAIVTGFDTRGYPLVNSHTADRFHVPFDLGWDKRTVYWFFRVHG